MFLPRHVRTSPSRICGTSAKRHKLPLITTLTSVLFLRIIAIACHGPDAKTRQANLRFDTKAGAFSEPSGYPVIVPGKPEESELHLRIVSDDDTYRMPPADFNKTLTPEHKLKPITQWIREGAKWEEHWAFTTPVRPTLPAVKDTETGYETRLTRSSSHGLKKRD